MECKESMDKALQGAGVNTEPGTTKAFAPHPHPPAELSVVTWNVDGLDERHLEGRAEEVCSIVGDIHPLPEFVLLQEVVGATAPIFMRRLRAYGYKCTDEGKHERHPYFTIGFFLASRVEVTRVEREAFHNSEMGRDLLKMFCNLKGAGGASPTPLLVMTSHLESEKRHGDARCEQFRSVLEQLRDSHVFAVVTPPPHNHHTCHTHTFSLPPPYPLRALSSDHIQVCRGHKSADARGKEYHGEQISPCEGCVGRGWSRGCHKVYI